MRHTLPHAVDGAGKAGMMYSEKSARQAAGGQRGWRAYARSLGQKGLGFRRVCAALIGQEAIPGQERLYRHAEAAVRLKARSRDAPRARQVPRDGDGCYLAP